MIKRLASKLSWLLLAFPLLLIWEFSPIDKAPDFSSFGDSTALADIESTQLSNELDLIMIQQGDVPIILSVPHGGTEIITGVGRRTRENVPGEMLGDVRDRETVELALSVNQELIKLLDGKKPYIVLSRIHRRYIDLNRTRRFAYQSENAAQYYDEYHSTLKQFVDEVGAKWSHGIVLDIHGQSRRWFTIMRGTLSGGAVTHWLENHGGWASVMGPESILGYMAQQGRSIWPADPLAIETEFNGGYITGVYSQQLPNVDVIQLESGRFLRTWGRRSYAMDLANGIKVFYDTYLVGEAHEIN